MTKIVTKSELRERYGVTQDDIDYWKYTLGEIRLVLEEEGHFRKDLKKAQKELRKWRKALKATNTLLEMESELESIGCDARLYNPLEGLQYELNIRVDDLIHAVTMLSDNVAVLDNYESNKVICIDNLQLVGEYNP